MKIKTICVQCSKEIEVEVPADIYEENPKCINGCTCNKCVPKNSPARDGINESLYTED